MIHKYIIIPENKLKKANDFFNSIGAVGESFTAKLYTGNAHSHYWCGWLITEYQCEQIQNAGYEIYDSFEEILTSNGLNLKNEIE